MEIGRDMLKQKNTLIDSVKIQEKEFSQKSIRQILNASSRDTNTAITSLLNELVLIEDVSNYTSKLEQTKLLKMSECAVSVTAKKVVDLVYETLNKALRMFSNAHDVKNVCMLCLIAKNLLELFTSVMQTFHRESLIEFPFLSAIAYNDFIYLAFNSLTLTHQ